MPHAVHLVRPSRKHSRPTAVNLMDACNRIKQLAQQVPPDTNHAQLVDQVIEFAEDYFAQDVATNKVGGEQHY